MAARRAVRSPPPGARATTGGQGVVEWIAAATPKGPTVHSAVPPGFACYATIVVPEDDAEQTRDDALLVQTLQAHTPEQPWWLGYLDTGSVDVVEPAAPRVRLYSGWSYVLLQGGPQQALTSRKNKSWASALPDLVFPADRSWLVSTSWDDDWRCIGAPAALIDDLIACPELQTRLVAHDEDMTPPGHVML